MLGYLGRKCSVFSAVRSVHVGGFAAGSFLGNSGDECNPVAAELHSEKGLPLWSGTHARIAGASSILPPATAPRRAAPHRTALSGCRPTELSGTQRVTAAPQPFCRESIAGRAASDTAG